MSPFLLQLPGDPLQALRDIHLPPLPGIWPPAPGWWWLAALGVALLTLGALELHRRWRQGGPRRAALLELEALRARHQRGEASGPLVAELATLLRRVAIVTRPPESVASLTGGAWLAFLDSSGTEREFSRGSGRCLARAPYRPGEPVDMEALLALCESWIRRNS